jgi:hypothetical protein
VSTLLGEDPTHCVLDSQSAMHFARVLAAAVGVKTEKEMMMDSHNNEVTIVDIKIPFWSMVVLMVKWAIAAIPAFLILVVLYLMLVGVTNRLFGG